MGKSSKELFDERLQLVNDAIAMKETCRVPVAPFFASVAQRLNGSSYRDLYYDYDRAGKAAVEFYKKYPVDMSTGCRFTSGKSNEIAESSMIDWPGRPGTKISIHSSHQVLEYEYIQPEEYRELIDNFDHFILTKYIPRAFPGLKGLENISFNPNIVLSTSLLGSMCTPEALEAFGKLAEISKLDAEAAAKSNEYSAQISELGIPPYFTGSGEVPFDIISDYFRGTLGAMTDSLEYEDEMLELCDIFVERQIKGWEYFKFAPMPVKRVFFPLHKGMDGFMSPEQYDRLYWKPFMKLVDYLVSIGVTPYVYTEGFYNSRLEKLCELPAGKCMVHFERVDMKRAKETVGKTNCIVGNLPISLMEFSTPDKVSDYVKFLIDTCAPGGGYIFDFDGSLENVKIENLDAMFDTLETYGKK
ncbi:MAG: uroporphyrinogen decarboxylase family protein [Lachnospiraceae bacterium]